MDAVLEPFPADRLFPGSSFLDLGDLNESDFLNNAHFPEHLDHFAENMEDFSNDLFSSFFDDPVLDEKSPLLDMELDSPTPGIQAEHSYSLSGDSAPQSPLVPIKMEDTTQGPRRDDSATSDQSRAPGGQPVPQSDTRGPGADASDTPQQPRQRQ